MDHILAGQTIRLGDPGAAGPAAAQRPALGQQLRPRRTVDTSIHAAFALKGFVCRVDNGICIHFCDVVTNDNKGHIVTTNSNTSGSIQWAVALCFFCFVFSILGISVPGQAAPAFSNDPRHPHYALGAVLSARICKTLCRPAAHWGCCST